MAWAKIDTALHRNPKVRMAGRDAREVYLVILLANAEQKADGELPAFYADPEYLADVIQCTREEAQAGLKRCVTLQLLHVTDDVVAISGWDDTWRVKGSADRVAKHRAKKKAEKSRQLGQGETACNVTGVTGNAGNGLDKKREIDKKRESEGARKRAHALPDSWKPTSKHRAKADEGRLDLAAEEESFRDHHLAKGSVMKDWDRAFNTWLRNAVRFAAGRQPSQPTRAPERML